MNKFKHLSLVALSLLLSACGSGSGDDCDGTVTGSCGAGGAGDPGDPIATVIQILTSSPQLGSDLSINAQNSVDLTAIVRDQNNAVMSGVQVDFQANNNGSINVTQLFTDNNGQAKATLSNGLDVTNRVITVTAQVASDTSISDLVAVTVTGTSLSLTGPTALAAGEVANYSLVLTDSVGNGVPFEAFTLASTNSNIVAPPPWLTGQDGDATVTLEAVNGGADAFSATALGEVAIVNLFVSDDTFEFDSPADGTEIDLNTPQLLRVLWEIASAPVVGGTIDFFTTRGTLTASSDTTDGSGIAEVSISSNNSGSAVVTARDSISLTETTLSIDFIATVADSINVQASPTKVGAGEQSTITAQVFDPSNNVVKNKTIVFELTDVSGGSLTVASDVTDSQGIAHTFYTAGPNPSAPDGVEVRAYVQDTPLIEGTVFLTVGGVALDVTVGTGNTLIEIPTAIFAKEWVVFVKDGVGNPVPGQDIQVRLLPTQYAKGWFSLPDPILEPLLEGWIQRVQAVCANEDPLYTGDVSDPSVVDENSNGTIEPGFAAIVAAVPDDAGDDPCTLEGFGDASSAADVVSNSNGIARVCIYWPENFSSWIEVNIEARANVSGTEFAGNNVHWLPMSGPDQADGDNAPANIISPYGVAAACSDPD